MNKAPNPQEVLGWRIVASLFLVGAGAGAYLIGFILNMVSPGFVLLSKLSIILAAPVVIAGALLLLCDMGRKAPFYLAFVRPLSSWIARGSIILTVFIILNLTHIFTWIWPSTALAGAPGSHLALGVIASIFAVLALVYTGLLLGITKPVPFWNSSFLPGLFLVSGISMGTMAAAFLLSVYSLSVGSAAVRPLMLLARCDVFIIIVEALIICFYLLRMHRLETARTSVTMLTRGRLAAPFWGGVVAAALVVPFVFEVCKAYVFIANPAALLVLTVVSSIIGLVGGFMLRYVVIYGGTRAPLSVEGVLVSPPPETYRVRVIERATYSTN